MTLPPDSVARLFDSVFPDPGNLQPRYNLCPTQTIHAALTVEGTRKIMPFRWGFIPHWYKKPADGPLLINARAETVAEKPAFREAVRARRCLIPATGYYEWTKAGDGGKDPSYIYPAKGEAFAFAGIYQDWTSPEGETLHTAAMLTVEASTELAHIHHRMPVIVAADDFGLWLGEKGKGAATLMRPAPLGTALSYRVSREVNKTRTDDISLLEPV